jgi:hypothetical protein
MVPPNSASSSTVSGYFHNHTSPDRDTDDPSWLKLVPLFQGTFPFENCVRASGESSLAFRVSRPTVSQQGTRVKSKARRAIPLRELGNSLGAAADEEPKVDSHGLLGSGELEKRPLTVRELGPLLRSRRHPFSTAGPHCAAGVCEDLRESNFLSNC